ncbi:MAG: HEAT repeat domain-containing protein [Phycisphaerae bacterium]|nr:HEAT repeat domain-containing protein [Phycisphaerae bacterium]
MHSPKYVVIFWSYLLAVVFDGALVAADDLVRRPASRPARRWGPAKSGLELSIEQIATVRRGGKFILSPALRNCGRIAAGLCPRADTVAWLILKSQPADGSVGKYYFSGRVFPGAGKVRGAWPESLASGGQLELAGMDFSDILLHPYSRGVKFLAHHVTGKGSIPEAAGKLRDVLVIGKVSVQYMLYLPRKGDSPIVLKSDFLTVMIGPPDIKSLSPPRRKAFISGLIAGFRGDAFAGQAAHGIATSVGSEILDDLIAATKDPAIKGAGRMWLATTLADIRDKRSAVVLVKLIDGSDGGVRHVVVYHGPKQRNSELDSVIVARALKSKDARMTVLAMLGFMVFRGEVPRKLLDAGIDSDDPRVRTTVVAALSKTASIKNVQGLVSLLKSKEQRVRSAAAKALAAMGNRQAVVVGALVEALSLEGDQAHGDVCNALGKLTGQELPYDRDASVDKKREVIAKWGRWWVAVRKDHR